MPRKKKQKLYCYVDESGLDAASRQFITVAIVVPSGKRDTSQQQLLEIERFAQTHGLKWHKTKLDRSIRYLETVVEKKIAKGQTFIGYFRKPTPYFFPMVDTIESALKRAAHKSVYKATVYVDGIDQKKSLELTNALRSHGIPLRRVRSARDESEPLIRLADMWAGCARSATLGNKQAKQLIAAAEKQKHLVIVTLKKPL